MEQEGGYRQYLRCATTSLPRRSVHRYKQQYDKLNDPARSTNDDTPAEEPEPEVCPQPISLPSPTSLAGEQGESSGCAENPADRADIISLQDDTPARQLPRPVPLCPASMESPPQDPMVQPLFPGAQVTHEESLLLLMAHILRHHDSKEATESLLTLLNFHLPQGTQLPATKYLFDKYFREFEQPLATHFYCPTCFAYIGVAGSDELNCVCGAKHSAKVLLQGGSYFLSLDWKAELHNLLEKKRPMLKKPGLKFDVSDITESPAYNLLPLGPDDITLTWNTDGIPIFHSSDYSVWPLEVMVNELPFKERMNNVLLAGLWFGPKKPNMQCFLVPFVEAMNELSTNGFSWIDSDGLGHVTKVYPGPCTVDTVARCMLHSQTQFNGKHGCCWCFHPGRVVPQGRGHARVYEVIKVKKRTDEDFEKDARTKSHGVLGTTVLSLMLFFSITNNTVVDYMHAVCLGVVRATTNLWFKSAHSQKSFYLGRKMSMINTRLKGMTPPYEFSHLPRSLCQRKHWKATEWRAWLLYYSPFALNGVLPLRYFRNWCRLSNVMHALLADVVVLDRLAAVEAEVMLFMREYQDLYGCAHMTFNIHLISHLCDSVRQWGPLWGFSAFPFENMNGVIKKSFHGTQYIPQQICRKLLLSQFLPTLANSNSCFISKPKLFQHFETLTRGYRKIFNVQKHANALTIGTGSQKLTSMEIDLIQSMGMSTCAVTKFKKVFVNGTKYIAHLLNKTTRMNSVVYLNDGTFGIIECVLVMCGVCTLGCNCEKTVYFFLRRAEARLVNLGPTYAHIHMLHALDHYRIVDVHSVNQKCVAFPVNGKIYASPLYRNIDY